MNLLFISLDPENPSSLAHAGSQALAVLDEICRESDAKVVLCVNQLREGQAEKANSLFQEKGSKHTEVIGVIQGNMETHRGYEVMTFLQNFGDDVSNYVVLDGGGDYFVWQPLIKRAPHQLNREIGYEVLRQLNPGSLLLSEWEQQYGYGDLLTLVEPPSR